MNAKAIMAVLEANGFERVRTKGGHAVYRKGSNVVTVPGLGRNKDVAAGTLGAIIRQSGLDKADFS